jgi:hypothetical protein
MNIDLKDKLRSEAKMFATLLVLLALPLLVFASQYSRDTIPAQATGMATLTIKPAKGALLERGVWNLITPTKHSEPVPFVVELQTGADSVDSVHIALTYDPQVFSFVSNSSIKCNGLDNTPSALPSISGVHVSQSPDQRTLELGLLTFTCKVNFEESKTQVPADPYSTHTIATLLATPGKTAIHSKIGFVITDADVLVKTAASSNNSAIPLRTVDAIVNIFESPYGASLTLASDEQYIRVNDQFSTDILLSTREPVNEVDVVLLYDPELLEPQSVNQGPLFPVSTLPHDEQDFTIEIPGRISFSTRIFPDSRDSVNGEKILVARVDFLPLKSALETTMLIEKNNADVYTDSNIISVLSNKDVLTHVSHIMFEIVEE